MWWSDLVGGECSMKEKPQVLVRHEGWKNKKICAIDVPRYHELLLVMQALHARMFVELGYHAIGAVLCLPTHNYHDNRLSSDTDAAACVSLSRYGLQST
jgi:hypothetical protein